jgi:methionyl aminopeptidase
MNEAVIQGYLSAGATAAAARDLGASMIRPGVRLEEVQLSVEELIRSRGAEPAFPAQISLDNVAAHDCCPPGDPRRFTGENIAKLDVGCHVGGFVADTAITVDLRDGPDSPLAKAAREALEAAIALARPGVPVSALGGAIASTIESHGFQPVTNLTGHGVGSYEIHCAPQVPNYAEKGGPLLRAGQAVAIEPFACTGRGWVRDEGEAQVYMLRRRPKGRDRLPLALEKGLATLHGLPFARRDLARFVGMESSEEALRLLLERDLLHPFPPLAELPGVRVSQAEHTLLFLPDRVLVITDPERPPLPHQP